GGRAGRGRGAEPLGARRRRAARAPGHRDAARALRAGRPGRAPENADREALMSGYRFTSDLLEDLLWRGGELFDGTSKYQVPQGLRYLNRGLEALALGGAEFEASIQEDWWWLRKSPPGVLTL